MEWWLQALYLVEPGLKSQVFNVLRKKFRLWNNHNFPHWLLRSLYMVSATPRQPRSENITWKVPEINNPYILNHAASRAVWENLTLWCPIREGTHSSVWQTPPQQWLTVPVTSRPLSGLIMAPEPESRDASNSEMPKRSYYMPSLSGKLMGQWRNQKNSLRWMKRETQLARTYGS